MDSGQCQVQSKLMATIFTHAVIGSTIAKLAARQTIQRHTIIACALLAALPDADGLFFGVIPYAHLFGHRGFTHSLLFAALCGLLTASLFIWREWIKRAELWLYALLFARATASHGILDALTNGGLGVAFFAPFNTSHYFFPFHPIPVSPMSGGALLSARGTLDYAPRQESRRSPQSRRRRRRIPCPKTTSTRS